MSDNLEILSTLTRTKYDMYVHVYCALYGTAQFCTKINIHVTPYNLYAQCHIDMTAQPRNGLNVTIPSPALWVGSGHETNT